MLELPAFIHPAPWSIAVFVLIVAAVWVCALAALARIAPPEQRQAWLVRGALVLAFWAGAVAVVSDSGLLATDMMPPPLMLFFGANLGACLAIALSPLGRRAAAVLPAAALIGFHAFRLPLELVLHLWVDAGTLPMQMTWTGHNLDIITGVLGLVVGLWAWRGAPPRWTLWAFQVVGLGLLIAVASIAVRSVPGPLRTYEEPVLLGLASPYSWIVPFCVGAALVGHIIGIRQLLAGAPATSPAPGVARG